MAPAMLDVHSAIRSRRSHKRFTGVPVADRVLAELVELATWAPNHRYTEPWRFTVVPHRALADLLAAIEAAQRGADGTLDARGRAQVDKIAEIVRPAGGAIAVRRAVIGDDPVRDREDYAACACAIQNIHLGAWALGIASYWTTSEVFLGAALRGFWHAAPGEELVGAVILGTAAAELKGVRYRRPEEVSVWVDVAEIGL